TESESRVVGNVGIEVRPAGHPAGPQQHHIARPQLASLLLSSRTKLIRRDHMAGRQAAHAVQARDVKQYCSGDEGRILVRAALHPYAAAEILVRCPAV